MSDSLSTGEAAALLGTSVDTVRRWCDEGRLGHSRDAGGRRLVDGADLARLLAEIAAPSRTATGPVVARSARNRFPGLVTGVERDGVMAKVTLQAGPHRITSLMTREAADELGLEPGVLAVAAVKSTNVIIEVPAGVRT
ncbi:MAG: helix-turn-helix transcriptional regulator [Actinobacteria bacterium]|nr:helix-turn-helix transcriptional regulator [Actinomycetota bacterium]